MVSSLISINDVVAFILTVFSNQTNFRSVRPYEWILEMRGCKTRFFQPVCIHVDALAFTCPVFLYFSYTCTHRHLDCSETLNLPGEGRTSVIRGMSVPVWSSEDIVGNQSLFSFENICRNIYVEGNSRDLIITFFFKIFIFP